MYIHYILIYSLITQLNRAHQLSSGPPWTNTRNVIRREMCFVFILAFYTDCGSATPAGIGENHFVKSSILRMSLHKHVRVVYGLLSIIIYFLSKEKRSSSTNISKRWFWFQRHLPCSFSEPFNELKIKWKNARICHSTN